MAIAFIALVFTKKLSSITSPTSKLSFHATSTSPFRNDDWKWNELNLSHKKSLE
jgi:hypothetical protein